MQAVTTRAHRGHRAHGKLEHLLTVHEDVVKGASGGRHAVVQRLVALAGEGRLRAAAISC